MKIADSPIADSTAVRIELPPTPAKPPKTAQVSLGDLEAEVSTLEAAFVELSRLKTVAAELESAVRESLREEKAIVGDPGLAEKKPPKLCSLPAPVMT
jgi:hypothetical protein